MDFIPVVKINFDTPYKTIIIYTSVECMGTKTRLLRTYRPNEYCQGLAHPQGIARTEGPNDSLAPPYIADFQWYYVRIYRTGPALCYDFLPHCTPLRRIYRANRADISRTLGRAAPHYSQCTQKTVLLVFPVLSPTRISLAPLPCIDLLM